MTAVFRCENTIQRYRERHSGESFEVLRVHEFEVQPGEILGVVGPNGAGKTTLLETLAFLKPPDGGRILLNGTDVWAQGTDLAARRRVPLLLQNSSLFSTTVLRNVMFGLRVRGESRSTASERAFEALGLVGLEHLARRRSSELSGGERRRVAMARVLALRSPVVILDEPMAGLDRESKAVLERVILALNRDQGVTVVMATHNVPQALKLSTRIATILQGRLVPGTVDNVFSGELRAEEEGFGFTGRNHGPRLALAAEAIARDPWLGMGPREGACVLAFSADGVEVQREQTSTAEQWSGHVESIARDGDSCRLCVQVGNDASVHARLPTRECQALGLGIGVPVALNFRPGAVRVLPPPDAARQR